VQTLRKRLLRKPQEKTPRTSGVMRDIVGISYPACKNSSQRWSSRMLASQVYNTSASCTCSHAPFNYSHRQAPNRLARSGLHVASRLSCNQLMTIDSNEQSPPPVLRRAMHSSAERQKLSLSHTLTPARLLARPVPTTM